MSEIQNNNNFNNSEEIDLREIFNFFWQAKLTILYISVIVTILGLIYSLLLPNIYESRAILSPDNSGSNISRSLRNFPGLAAPLGVNIPYSADESNSVKAIEKLSSLSFFENSILPKIFLPDLMAHKSWNSKTNSLNYKDNIYDLETNKWIKKTPSAQKSYRQFKGKHFSLSENKKTGFITITIRHKSPFVAKKWAELMVNEVNSFYREKDKSEAEKSVNYLNQQIAMTNFSEVKEAISNLLQEETKKLALIEAKEFYVFEYIDPPAVMEKKSEPKRSLIIIISALLGGILSIVYISIKRYF